MPARARARSRAVALAYASKRHIAHKALSNKGTVHTARSLGAQKSVMPDMVIYGHIRHFGTPEGGIPILSFNMLKDW